ncbi:MAG: hypothetical protein K2L72_06340 [Clostridia bacterium]|nr:hypothetical protein [Clostridia bacterium]
MSDKKEKKTDAQPETNEELPQGKKAFVCLYIAIGCLAAGCILLALSFFIKGFGVHMLIASMIAELASVSFLNGQKRRAPVKAGFALTIISYVVMAAALIVFVVGIGVANSAK